MLALAILGPAQIAGRLAWKTFGSSNQSTELCHHPVRLPLCAGAAVAGVWYHSLGTVSALDYSGACYGVHTILRPGLAQLYLRRIHLGQGLGTIAMVGVLMMAFGPAVGGFVWTHAGMSGLMWTILGLNMYGPHTGGTLAKYNT